MKVSIISYTDECELIVASAGKATISGKSAEEIIGSMSSEAVERWIREIITRDHGSVLEHCVYTFSVEGISRVASHQLVRHRIASYSQLSQRYRKIEEEIFDVVVPPSVRKMGKQAESFFREYADEAFKRYRDLISHGIPPEDARYILPQAVTTKLIITMNAREIMHFLSLRLCSRAQWELRSIAWCLLRNLLKLHPNIWKWAGPRCVMIENVIKSSPQPIIEKILADEDVDYSFVSQKCPEGIPREKIAKCILNGKRDVWEIIKNCEQSEI
ncbi:MAG: FAD-dependent thymidylate synthase [Fervidicoccaceae archaeon]